MNYRIIHQEPKYIVTDEGKVINTETNLERVLTEDRYGYLKVTLYPSAKTYTAHRLVMTNFYPPNLWMEHIDHINCNKKDNRLSNLEWVTAKENIRRARKNGVWPSVVGLSNPMAKLNIDEVWNIRFQLDDIPISIISNLYGISRETVRRIRVFETYKDVTYHT